MACHNLAFTPHFHFEHSERSIRPNEPLVILRRNLKGDERRGEREIERKRRYTRRHSLTDNDEATASFAVPLCRSSLDSSIELAVIAVHFSPVAW
jgi:hypothetical protein